MILRDLAAVISLHRPTEVAVEKVFVNVNPQSTLLLGQARGAAISAAVLAELPVVEYTALQVKQAVVGHGKAAKEQVRTWCAGCSIFPASRRPTPPTRSPAPSRTRTAGRVSAASPRRAIASAAGGSSEMTPTLTPFAAPRGAHSALRTAGRALMPVFGARPR